MRIEDLTILRPGQSLKPWPSVETVTLRASVPRIDTSLEACSSGREVDLMHWLSESVAFLFPKVLKGQHLDSGTPTGSSLYADVMTPSSRPLLFPCVPDVKSVYGRDMSARRLLHCFEASFSISFSHLGRAIWIFSHVQIPVTIYLSDFS